MSSNITNISHGQTNWDTVVNQNFENLDTDSGWIEVPILAPFTGHIYLRKYAHLIEINGTFWTDEELSSPTEVAIIPTDLNSTKEHYFVTFVDGNGRYARMSWSSTGALKLFDVYPTHNDIYVRFFETITI